MPASVTSSTRSPARGLEQRGRPRPTRCPRSRTPPGRRSSTPSSVASRLSRRVSSAATTSAPASSSASRGGASRDPADRGGGQHQHAGAVDDRTDTRRSSQPSRRRTVAPVATRRDRDRRADARPWGCRGPPTADVGPQRPSAGRGRRGADRGPAHRLGGHRRGHALALVPAAVEPRLPAGSSCSTRPTTPRTPGRCCTTATPANTSTTPTPRSSPATSHGMWTTGAEMVVHPEVGKWLIALGEQLFGMDPFGWRIAAPWSAR